MLVMQQFCSQVYCQVPVQPDNYMLILPYDIDMEFILEFYTDPDSFRYSHASKFSQAYRLQNTSNMFPMNRLLGSDAM
jgi:hypothetical protein